MTRNPLHSIAAVALSLAAITAVADAQSELEQPASWQLPDVAQVKAQLEAFLQSQTLDETVRPQIEAVWSDFTSAPEAGASVLDGVATALALVHADARQIVEFCRGEFAPAPLPAFPVLEDEQQPAFLRANLKLFYGRWLAQHQCYDEAIEQLRDLSTMDVVDPAALLFYQSVSYHRMPDKRKCLPLVAQLLEHQQRIPRRYAALAQLIQTDLAPLEPDSLDEISRLMDEVRRRLNLQRAGTRVREQEDEVLAKLDKLISKIEEQQQQQQQQASAGSLQPATPAQDSMPMGGLGPGNIDPKQLGTKSGWGNLPPAERQEVLQQIGKDLPAHYREVIEEYFRKLAREGSGP